MGADNKVEMLKSFESFTLDIQVQLLIQKYNSTSFTEKFCNKIPGRTCKHSITNYRKHFIHLAILKKKSH